MRGGAFRRARAAAAKPECCTSALRSSHVQLRDELTRLAEELLAALPCGPDVAGARERLVDFVRARIIPAAIREEALARSASGQLDLVRRALPGHHRMLAILADEIASQGSDVTTAAAVGALVLLCEARWDGEDDVLIPALATSGVDLEPLVS